MRVGMTKTVLESGMPGVTCNPWWGYPDWRGTWMNAVSGNTIDHDLRGEAVD